MYICNQLVTQLFMNKVNYVSPYDSSDIGTIIDRLVDDYIINDDYNGDDYEELEIIINDAINQFNNNILHDEDIDDEEDLDYQDLKDDMYQSIQDMVIEKYSKVIKD